MPRTHALASLLLCALGVSAVLFTSGCGGGDESANTLTLATTTSARDSGLLDELLPVFESESGIEVRVIAVGSGQALEMGRRGDADVLLTHAPAAEEAFVEAGHGVDRRVVMQNDFVLLGPPDDPAEVKRASSLVEVLERISKAEAEFASRGDDSGTHSRERELWAAAEIEPEGDWYRELGSGMAATVRYAAERDAYTLCDRATYLVQGDREHLVILSAGDARLANRYSTIRVSPQRHPHVNADGAERLVEFLASETGQRLIAEFGRDRFGEGLFEAVAEFGSRK